MVEDTHLQLMISNGMDLVRLEFVMDHLRNYQALTEKLRRAAEVLGAPVGIIVEIPGINSYASPTHSNYLEVTTGQHLTLTTDPQDCSKRVDSCIELFNKLTDEIAVGDAVKFGDGQVRGTVTAKSDTALSVEISCVGVIEQKTRVYISNTSQTEASIQAKCLENYRQVLTLDPDFVCYPFSAEHFREELEGLRQVPGFDKARLLAKIKSEFSSDELMALVEQIDGVLVARYGLGMEMPIERICVYQKQIVKTCQRLGKPVLISGQVLGSLRSLPYPLRAEASDVYNGVLDGIDGFVLAQEVLTPENWENTMQMLSNIISKAEERINYRKFFQDIWDNVSQPSTLEAISSSAVKTSIELDCKLMVCITHSSKSPRLISKYKTPMAFLTCTNDQRIAQKVIIHRGCVPVFCKL
jgi:pyruvate kinase